MKPTVMTEILEAKFDLKPPFMKDIFMEQGISYDLKHGNDLAGFRHCTATY